MDYVIFKVRTNVIVLHACTHGGPRFIVSSRRTFVESAQNLTPERSQGKRKAYHVTVTYPFSDHVRLESEYSCLAPLNLCQRV